MAKTEIRGLREFRAELKLLGAEWPAMLRALNKKIADTARDAARAEASTMGGLQAKAAQSIQGYATQTSASVGPSAGARAPYANVAFWGAKAHTGWYGAEKYANGPPNQPAWVGSSWEAAVAGQGPYAINAALAKKSPELLEDYGVAIDELAAIAFH